MCSNGNHCSYKIVVASATIQTKCAQLGKRMSVVHTLLLGTSVHWKECTHTS